jgi:CrcB protein
MTANLGLGVLLLLGLAGAAGAAARFAFSEWANHHWRGDLPLATLAINATGAFALGLLSTLGGPHATLAETRLLLGTGFLGGYTTFSTLSYDTHSLFRSGQHRAAWLNAVASLALGIGAAGLGLLLGAQL